MEAGGLHLQRVNPAELSPGQFARDVCRAVDASEARVVVIDSLNGYMSAMPDEKHLSLHLHELLSALGARGVATVLVMAQHGLVGPTMAAAADVSYLADAVILLRYFESHGSVRTAASVLKKRTGRHERTLREFTLGATGLRLGPPLREFRGVLTGVPTHTGDAEDLLDEARGAPGD
jgi:circadian clock protein KaiC